MLFRSLGTAGAIKKVEDKLGDTFVAINGDVFSHIDIEAMTEEHFSSEATVTISLTEVQNPCEYGIARLEKDGRISEFREKPKAEEVFSNLINAGIYIVQKEVLSLVPAGQYDFSKELVPELMKRGCRIQGYVYTGPWLDVGRPSDLIGANLMAATTHSKKDKLTEGLSESSVKGPFYIGEGSSMKNSVSDSSVVHKGCTVTDSNLTGSLIMKDCTVISSKLSNSILGKGCKVDSSIIEDSVLGDGTVLKNTKMIGNEVVK